ncbi:amidase family protein [Aquibacillus salsiterrae]|uniref:Amidase family protein n=1 Tax=Aquibacillus salsiterrae TaxID=2950439 RepID=A0A9X4AG19_9BACI|nr:amidase family protein [Aquibacillus salsiterrae]MDC3416633.1 amidase family protein [Aquibacillus salsiterrae]
MKFNQTAKTFVTVSVCSAILTMPTLSYAANGNAESAISKNQTAVENVLKNPNAGQSTGIGTFQVEETTIAQIQKALQTGQLTSVKLVQMYIDRIKAYDQKGPAINSVLTLNPDALEIAAEMDKQRGKGKKGPLYGIPVLLKDNVDTKDNMPTTAGTIALKDNYASKDSWVAAKLREAGAIILGKTNMSEWAYFMTQGAPSGYSAIGGQVKHPYGPDTFPAGSVGGSSSGSGAAIASNFATVAIGTETSGSILSPSSANSIVGIKPTVGLVSRTGIIPLSMSQDTAGPMARTVKDAAVTLGVLTGVDPTDPITETSEGKALTDYTKHLKINGLDGARIGIDYGYLRNSEQREVIEEAIEVMKSQGAIIDEVTIQRLTHRSQVLWYEFKHNLNDYLSKTSDDVPVKTLADIIEFNKQDPEVRMKYGQIHLERSQALSDSLDNPTYLEQRANDLKYSREAIDSVMKDNDLDALLFANNNGAATPAKAGYPSITVPAGYTESGMPVGVTFSATAYSEARLIELAYSYEQHSKVRVAPVWK